MPSAAIDNAEKGVVELEPFAVSVILPGRLRQSLPSLPAPSRHVSSHLPVAHLPEKRLSLSNAKGSHRPPPKVLVKRASRWIRFQLWFNMYRKLFTLVMSFNLVGLSLAIFNVWTYPRKYTSPFVLGNLLVAILVRNELFGRFLYLLVNTLFAKWPPLTFRLLCTSALQHLGGIHSGCATSGFLWLIFRLATIPNNHKNNHSSILVMGALTIIVTAISIGSALPWLREKHHNVFERHHRFMGWLGLIFTWFFVVLGDSYDFQTQTWIADRFHVIKQQDFWFALGMTAFVIIPWFTVQKVKVDVEIPSAKVAIMRFERGMQQGLLARIGRGSIMEYHLFGIVSEGTHSKEHYLICGVQGDFTRSLVDDPPTHVWTRQLKFAGVSNTSTLYKRGIRICTGTGLGGALSTCLQNPDWYLIWIGSDQEKTFGPTIASLIRRNMDPDRYTLWDTKERGGRPDVMTLVKDAYYSWGAEVVFITSNFQGNREITEGCKEAGIPAVGTLWDF